MDRRYKPLRPAIASPGRPHPGAESSPPEPGFKRKRVHVKVACETCRTKKTACDGQRPACGPCNRRGTTCIFRDRTADFTGSSSEERDRRSNAAEVLNALMSEPDDRALETLTQLRKGGPSAVLGSRRGVGVFDVTGHRVAGSTVPFTPDQDSVEFELMIRHPIPYPSVSLDLHTPDASGQSSLSTTASLEVMETIEDTEAQGSSSVPQPMVQPDPAEAYCDARLGRVNFKSWTAVPLDDAKAAQAISRFLQVDHPLLGIFDADLFLQDLVGHVPTRYCSSLLVNALLSWACLGHTFTGPPQANYGDLFFAKATNLLQDESRSGTLTTLAALQFLSLTAMFTGHGEMGQHLIRESIRMGKHMHLLKDGEALTDEAVYDGDDLRAATQAAWGLFSYATLHSLHCQKGELGSLHPPALSMPGEHALPIPAKGVVQSPPAHLGPVFPYLCRLWKIVHNVVIRYYFNDKSRGGFQKDRFSPEFVQGILKQLLLWGDSLPTSLARGNRGTHEVTIMHIYFHASMMSLLRPLMLHHDETPLGVGSKINSSAAEIYAASVNQMGVLTTVYQLQFSLKSPTVLWHTACLYSANAAIRGPNLEPLRRHYFDTAIEGYASLYPRFPVTIGLVKGLMTMAMADKLISTKEAYELVKRLREKGEDRQLIAEPTAACFMVDLDLAMTDLNGAHIDNLAHDFDEMAMFDEFTHGRADEDVDVAIN